LRFDAAIHLGIDFDFGKPTDGEFTRVSTLRLRRHKPTRCRLLRKRLTEMKRKKKVLRITAKGMIKTRMSRETPVRSSPRRHPRLGADQENRVLQDLLSEYEPQ
jgi:hypothetical protein